MKKRLTISILSLATLAGCATSDKTFAVAADQFVNKTVGPEYIAYINKDERLTPADKNDRILNVTAFRQVIAAKLAE